MPGCTSSDASEFSVCWGADVSDWHTGAVPCLDIIWRFWQVLVVDLANGAADADAAARTQSAALVDKSKDSQEDDSEDLSTHVSS